MSSESPQTQNSPQNAHTGNWLDAAMSRLGGGLLSFARFTGLVIDTHLGHMEEGFEQGGELRFEARVGNYRGLENARMQRLSNSLVSCIYVATTAQLEGRMERRETVDLIRKDKDGGAILWFSDGQLVGGITNAIQREFFYSEEVVIADRILQRVKNEIEAQIGNE